LTEIFSEFLEFTNKKPKFMEHLENKVKQKQETEVKAEKEVELV